MEEWTRAKKAAGYYAAELIEDKMVVGIGTGSTVFFFIERLAQRCRSGLNITAIPSSTQSEKLAKKGQIPLADFKEYHPIDITVDGADEIDEKKQMIKGGGGALVREKIVASSSREVIIIIDPSKQAPTLGSQKLPVEIVPFYFSSTIEKIKGLDFEGTMRRNEEGNFFLTDNGNFIFDLSRGSPFKNPHQTHLSLISLPGVVETGLFLDLAHKVIIGQKGAEIKVIE